ncbi:MAG: aldehyde dehydrogenase family protein, partial [Myxococcota bacterium]
AYGGPEEGRHLAAHAGVDAVHLTGSEETFASLRGEVSHPFTGALGGVGPVVVVPGTYARSELDAMAWTVAGMLTDNAGFNCYAASVLLLAEWWPQRRAFLDRLDAALSRVPTRLAYHPGALARHAALTEGKRFRSLGERSLTRLPWTVIEDLDPDADERLYRMAPFCGLLGVVSLAVGEPEAFLHSATRFAEERLKGSLAATLFVSGPFERSASGAQALDAAIDGLTYGTVAVNTSPSSAHALMAPAWGPHASHEGSQSQVWTHNTHLLEGIEKTVLRGPLNLAPRPRWPAGCPPYELGCRLLDMEASPSVRQLPGLTWATLGADFRTSGW